MRDQATHPAFRKGKRTFYPQADESSKLTVRTLVLPGWRSSFSSIGMTPRPVRPPVPFSRPPRVGCAIPATRRPTSSGFQRLRLCVGDEPCLPQDGCLADGRCGQDCPGSRRSARAQPAEHESGQVHGPAWDQRCRRRPRSSRRKLTRQYGVTRGVRTSCSKASGRRPFE